MKATAYIFSPRVREPEIVELTACPDLEWYRGKLDGGFIEQIPRFDKILLDGQSHPQRCVAFCDEEGKLKSLPFNRVATGKWYFSLMLDHPKMPNGLIVDDALFGTVIVLVGDDEFMEAL